MPHLGLSLAPAQDGLLKRLLLIADPCYAKETAEEWDSTVKKLMFAPDTPGCRSPLNQFALDHRHYLLGKIERIPNAAKGMHIYTPGDDLYSVYLQKHPDGAEFLVVDLGGS
jgi:hypothetical protein